MDLSFPVARHLDDPPRILGLSPNELAASALFYAGVSPILRGVPLAALLSLGLTAVLTTTLVILGRTFPRITGYLPCLGFLRPGITWVMPLREKVSRRSRRHDSARAQAARRFAPIPGL